MNHFEQLQKRRAAILNSIAEFDFQGISSKLSTQGHTRTAAVVGKKGSVEQDPQQPPHQNERIRSFPTCVSQLWQAHQNLQKQQRPTSVENHAPFLKTKSPPNGNEERRGQCNSSFVKCLRFAVWCTSDLQQY